MMPLPSQVSSFVDQAGRIIRPWVQYLQQFTQAPPKIMDVTVTVSPFSYTAKEPGYLYIHGGTISAITLTRGIVTLIFTGNTAVPVAINDIVSITYTVLPTVKFVPSYGQNTTS